MSRIPVILSAASLLMGAAVADAQVTREVSYNARTLLPVHAKLRFTTMIILPDHEEILDFVCGDKEFWIVSGAQNLAYVKPAKAGASTNLNLVTASGNVYSFLLTEGDADADVKIYVEPDESLKRISAGPKKFVSAADVEELRRAAAAAREEAQAARQAAENTAAERINAFKASYPTRLSFPYRFKAGEKPFLVSAIFTDGTFTYIKSSATELPALYELRDGTPNLVTFQVEQGVYIVPKVLDRGYLAVGKQTFPFARVER